MDFERIKEFLQNYIDTVVSPKYNQQRIEFAFDPIEFTVFQILQGSYNPPIVHVFLDTEPIIKKTMSLKPGTSMLLSGVEKDIENFLKVFSINNKIKVHWNKRPLFNNATLSADY